MRAKESFSVGLVVLLAGALLVWATFYLRRDLGRGDTYRQPVVFTDAQGIQRGAYVRIRGVDVGYVEDVQLGPAGPGGAIQPVVQLRVRKKDYPAISRADNIRVVGALFGFNQPYVEITPVLGGSSAAPGEMLTGVQSASMDKMMADVANLMPGLSRLADRMNELAGNMGKLVGDPSVQGSLRKTAVNLAKVSDSGVVIAGHMEETTAQASRLLAGYQGTAEALSKTLKRADDLLVSFRSTAGETQSLMRDTRDLVGETRGVVKDTGALVKNSNTAVTGAGALVTDTRKLLADNRAAFKEVLDTLGRSLKQLEGTVTETRAFLTDPALQSDLKGTAANLKDATANLKKISADVEGLTGNQDVQQDLRETISNLRDVSSQASDVFERVKGVLGNSGKAAKSLGQRFSDAQFDATLMRSIRQDRTRLDLDATIPWSDSTFYRLGFFDFGETNKFNVQLGQRIRPNVWGRYGIRGSKLGVGLEYGSGSHPLLTLDAFGLDRPQGEIRGNIPLTRSVDLTLGLNDLFFRTEPVIGLRYRK